MKRTHNGKSTVLVFIAIFYTTKNPLRASQHPQLTKHVKGRRKIKAQPAAEFNLWPRRRKQSRHL